MNKLWSKEWAKSKQTRKQRKYRYNAPINIKRKYLSSNLSKELRNEFKKRSASVKKGDSIKVLRGSFKDKTGKIEKVDVKKSKIYCKEITMKKVNGTEVQIALDPSNVQLIDVDLKDPKRGKALKRK